MFEDLECLRTRMLEHLECWSIWSVGGFGVLRTSMLEHLECWSIGWLRIGVF